jgi:hypothetical protein
MLSPAALLAKAPHVLASRGLREKRWARQERMVIDQQGLATP